MRALGFRGFDYENPPKNIEKCEEIMRTVELACVSAEHEKEKIYTDEKLGIPVDNSKLRGIHQSHHTAKKTRLFLQNHIAILRREKKAENDFNKRIKSEQRNNRLILILRDIVGEKAFKIACKKADEETA